VREFIALDHPRFVKAHRDIFTSKVTADCMTHTCRIVDEPGKVRLDACCQYGVDVDLAERDNILSRHDELVQLLDDDVAEIDWFDDKQEEDPDFPSGRYVRTRTHDKGCIFLSHDARGCAIHRASLLGGWDFRGTKPHVCRLFPLTYETDAIVVSDDYPDYSCSRDLAAPSLYRVSRNDLGDIFGDDLVAAMDQAEKTVLDHLARSPDPKTDDQNPKRKLPVLPAV